MAPGPSKYEFQGGNPNKRRRLDVENGDRFCSQCGLIIKGLIKDFLKTCPHANCKNMIPYTQKSFQFAKNGWSRCSGHLCGAFIEDTMFYCETCGMSNGFAFEKDRRIQRAAKMQSDAKMAARLKKLEEESRALKEENQKLRNTATSQEMEVFGLKQMAGVRMEDFIEDDDVTAEVEKAVNLDNKD